MSNDDRHAEVLRFLLNEAQLSTEEIDALTPEQLDDLLQEYHVDLKRVESLVSQWQKKASGRLALARARAERLAASCEPSPTFAFIPKLRDELLAGLVAHFGALDKIPMAARRLESVDDDELRQLYVDAVLRKKAPSANNETDKPNTRGE